MKINVDVKSCYDCPYSTNSSIEHDDPFVSAPYPTRWWCILPEGPSISDPQVIHPNCPKDKTTK